MNETIKALKEEACRVMTKAYKENLVAGTSGNISAYDPESGLMVVTPSGLDYDLMTPDDMMVIKLDGTIVEGTHKPSSEWRLHAEIYKAKPEARAVLHTHSPYATACAVTQETIPVILIEMFPFLGGDIKVADFGVPGTTDVGTNAVKALEGRYTALLANHGVVAFGKDLEQAHVRAVYAEDAAKIYYFARTSGQIKLIPEEAQDIMRKKFNLPK